MGEIADASYRFEREVNAGRRVVVGVNRFTDGDDDAATDLLRIEQDTEDYQLKRLDQVKRARSQPGVDAALAEVRRAAADGNANLMPPIIDAVRAYATEEEISQAMASVFGTYTEKVIV